MSRTYKHVGKGYWNNGIQDETIKEVKKYLLYCKRHNREVSYFSVRKNNIKNKISKKQMDEDLNEFLTMKDNGLVMSRK